MSEKQQKKHEFKAEIKQLLNILVHSLYTSREIFLRELISNASDALDKMRFESNRTREYANPELPYEIRITFDDKKNLLTITDTGIGMNEIELIENIGTIAKSGSIDFLNKLKDQNSDINSIIGKFGVGFYSVFMVAQEVSITTRSFESDGAPIQWRSDGLGEYTLSYPNEAYPRGTSITIHLKEDAKEFASESKLENVIQTHSNFISYPIFLGDKKINTIPALWREARTNITPEQYQEFYKFLTYDSNPPADTIHISVDAPIQFNGLLFIPEKSVDLLFYNREDYGLDLYVRRVLIQHKNKDLLPDYLSFVKGVVDSEDLPLNISRETLQENDIFKKIAKSVTSQVYSHLARKAKDEPEKYLAFWNEHGKIFKLGYQDYANRDKLMELLRFHSSVTDDDKKLISLEEYTSQMKEGQKDIFYLSGASRSAIELNPLIELFKKKGIPLLYLTDPVDEFVIGSLHIYKDHTFKSAGLSDTSEIEKMADAETDSKDIDKLSKDDEKHFDSLLAKMKLVLGEKVKEVKESTRLTTSAICLVNTDDAYSAVFMKMMRNSGRDVPPAVKTMLVNKDNKLIRNLLTIFKVSPDSDYVSNMVHQLYEIAELTDGDLPDPQTLAKRLLKYFEDSSDWFAAQYR